MINSTIINLIGFIGYVLISHYYFERRSDNYSNIILIGYILLALTHIPIDEDNKKENEKDNNKNKQEKDHDSNTSKLGHFIVALYYGYKILAYKMNFHSMLGLISNGLFLTKYRKYSKILLLIFYTEKILHKHGSIASYSLCLYYLLTLLKDKL